MRRAVIDEFKVRRVVERFVGEVQALVRQQASAELGEKIIRLTKGPKAPYVRKPKQGFIRAAHRRSAEQLNTTKDRVRKLLVKKPGLRSEQMQAVLKVDANILALPITQMLDDGELKCEGKARGRRYWVK